MKKINEYSDKFDKIVKEITYPYQDAELSYYKMQWKNRHKIILEEVRIALASQKKKILEIIDKWDADEHCYKSIEELKQQIEEDLK